MKVKLTNCILLSDVDGTLLPPGQEIPQRNIQAIERFTNNGGRFGIATGRSSQWVTEILGGLPVNAPCVMYNGGVVHDFSSGETLMELFLPESARIYLDDIVRTKSNIAALVVTKDEDFNIKQEQNFANYIKHGVDISHFNSQWYNTAFPWYKVLFLVPNGSYFEFMEYVSQQHFPGVRFVGTNSTLIEMLPEDSSKGHALKYLMTQTSIKREQLVAIGDYYNDLEMIELAGIGATLADSPEDIRERADIVVRRCQDGAIADLIEYLESHYNYQ